MRLLSFCFYVKNIRKIIVQDLGYLFWDFKAVSSYQQLENTISIKNHIFQNRASALLVLKQDQRSRSWQFDSKNNQWIGLPERMYAEYALKPIR